jgi:hypothetical protein
MSVLNYFLFIFLISIQAIVAQAESGSSDNKTFGFKGYFIMGTNDIEHGLTQTRHDPSVQGEYHFLLGPQLSMGAWGGNASFLSEDNHVHLKYFMNLKVDYDPAIYFRLKYSYNHFSQNSSRNGNVISLYMFLFGLVAKVNQESNFENTSSASSHYSLGYKWQIGQFLSWENSIETNNLTTDQFSSYYDYESVFDLVYSNLSILLGFTTVSNKSQFLGQADPMLYMQVKSNF